MTLTKHHIEVTVPSIHETGEEKLFKFPNWKEACAFIELFKPEWANCREVEDYKHPASMLPLGSPAGFISAIFTPLLIFKRFY